MSANEKVDLDIYQEMLNKATPSILTDTYSNFVTSERIERRLFEIAIKNGLLHLNRFRAWKINVTESFSKPILERIHQRNIENIQILEEAWYTGDEELDNFRRMVRYFDWYYDYSDDSSVWRSAKAKHDLILKTVKEKGGIYKTIWDTAQKKHLERHEKRQEEIRQERNR